MHLGDQFTEYIVNDLDEEKISMLKENLKVYGKKSEKITFKNFDFLKLAPFKTDAIILCPPWGGVSIKEYTRKDPDTLMKPKLSEILEHALKFSKNIILQMPKTTNINNLINVVLRCRGLRPLFTVEKIFRNEN